MYLHFCRSSEISYALIKIQAIKISEAPHISEAVFLRDVLKLIYSEENSKGSFNIIKSSSRVMYMPDTAPEFLKVCE